MRRPGRRAVALLRRHDWSIGASTGALAIAALVAGSAYGNLHSSASLQARLIAWTSAGSVVVFGAIASSRISAALARLVVERGATGAGGAVRVVTAGVGYLFVVFSFLAVVEVSVEKILVGAGLAGVVLGIAAQQSLGNVFAGLVLLVARPFKVGDHVRVRAGALGGLIDAWVLEMSLTYVTLHTEDGLLKVPNSVMLAAGIGQLPRNDPPGNLAASAPRQAGRARRRPARSGARPAPGALSEGPAELEQ